MVDSLSEADVLLLLLRHLRNLCFADGQVPPLLQAVPLIFCSSVSGTALQKEELQKENPRMSPVTKEEKKKVVVSVPLFTIEADHPRNCDLLLQSIPNCRLRSAIKASRTVDVESTDGSGEVIKVIPKDQARHLGSLPPIPGMQLSVNPTNLTYEITDTLFKDKALCKRISAAMGTDDRPFMSDSLSGVPPQGGSLDVHRMKTLCREIMHLLNAKHVVMRKGLAPDLEDINDLPGHYLLNPGSRVPNNQPLFEKDLPGYVETVQKSGG